MNRLLLLTGSLLALISVGGKSQDDLISKTIDFECSNMTMSDVAKSITKQTGLQVKLPEFAKPRRIAVAGRKQSVRRILDTICDLEGWSWSTNQEGSTARIVGPENVIQGNETVYMALKRITPPDLAQYLALPAPDKFDSEGMSDAKRARQADLKLRFKGLMDKYEGKLKERGVFVSKMMPDEIELTMLRVMLNFNTFGMGGILNNSDWQLTQLNNSSLRIEKESILIIDCARQGEAGKKGFGVNLKVD